MSKFIFKDYWFDRSTCSAHFEYAFEDGRSFDEIVRFSGCVDDFDVSVLDRALRLAWLVAGVSYYKTFPSSEVIFERGAIDQWQADFLTKVYNEGLGQFAYENKLTRSDLVRFKPIDGNVEQALGYEGAGNLALQSGGKDSLLTAALLEAAGIETDFWYSSSTQKYPKIIDELGGNVYVTNRKIDTDALDAAKGDGALNGHVPVTYILQSYALIQAILLNKNAVITSVAHEGEEPHAKIGDLSVTHQWSKTWDAEQMFAEYVIKYVSGNLRIGSLLRGYTELRVAELFVDNCWSKYGHSFSSCNQANYKQGSDNSQLAWCGNCPKCANSYLLFAPFVDAKELKSLFSGKDLFQEESLLDTFKGLLAIDGATKPFECIGEVDELRLAYGWSQRNGGYASMPFEVEEGPFDYLEKYPVQPWVGSFLN